MYDSSGHAVINAFRKAGKKLGDKNLRECIIYCTCEPCVMCLSAITFAKIKKIIYGTPLKDVSQKDNIIDVPLEYFLSNTPYKIEVVGRFMEEECRNIIKNET